MPDDKLMAIHRMDALLLGVQIVVEMMVPCVININ